MKVNNNNTNNIYKEKIQIFDEEINKLKIIIK